MQKYEHLSATGTQKLSFYGCKSGKPDQLRPLSFHSYTTTPRSLSVLITASTFRRTCRPRAHRNLMRLFHRYHPPVGPEFCGTAFNAVGQIAQPHIQVLPPRANRPQHPTDTQIARVRICLHYMQRHHSPLHRQIRILPHRQTLHRHVARLRGRRNQLHLLPRQVNLVSRSSAATAFVSATLEKPFARSRSGASGSNRVGSSRAGRSGKSTHNYQHIKPQHSSKLEKSVEIPPHHRPAHTAGRFSRNALVPSALSAVPHSRPKISASTSVAAAKPSSLPQRTASRHPATASGAIPTIVPASASARSINRSGATTSSTSPIRKASAAANHLAGQHQLQRRIGCPTSRGSRCVPPYPGISPSFTSGCPIRAVSLASRIVQAIASSHPPPSANPLIHAITGLPQRLNHPEEPPARAAPSPLPSRRPAAAISLMSAPAANAFSPAPVSRITRTLTSSVKVVNACSSSLNTFAFSACSTSAGSTSPSQLVPSPHTNNVS